MWLIIELVGRQSAEWSKTGASIVHPPHPTSTPLQPSSVINHLNLGKLFLWHKQQQRFSDLYMVDSDLITKY